MRNPAEILTELAASGLSVEQIMLVSEYGLASVSAVSRGPSETDDERKKRISRETSRKWREGRDVSPNVTNASPGVTADTVTKCHQLSPGDRNASPPHARVEDKPLRLVLPCNPISSFSDDDWPKDEPHGFAKRLAMMAGPGLGDPAKEPGLTTTSPEIIRWRQMGCSWSLDVVPTIQARTLKARDRPITGWNLLTRDVLAAKARREKPVDIPTISSGGQFMSSGQQAAAMRREGVENLLRKLESE